LTHDGILLARYIFVFLLNIKTEIMKKLVFIAALFIVAIAAQSCCVTSNCPGVAQVETPQINS